MDTREKDIENLKDYKYGFSTDIENTKAPKGLNEDYTAKNLGIRDKKDRLK